MSITHATTATGADDPTKEINKGEWNAAHAVAAGTIYGYTVPLAFVFGAAAGPADSTTYFGGLAGTQAVGAAGSFDTWAEAHFEIPIAGTITAVSYSFRVGATLGSGESVTTAIRINDTTDIAADAAARLDVAFETVTVTGLSTAVAAGDKIALKSVMPAFATNPTGVAISALVFIGSA